MLCISNSAKHARVRNIHQSRDLCHWTRQISSMFIVLNLICHCKLLFHCCLLKILYIITMSLSILGFFHTVCSGSVPKMNQQIMKQIIPHSWECVNQEPSSTHGWESMGLSHQPGSFPKKSHEIRCDASHLICPLVLKSPSLLLVLMDAEKCANKKKAKIRNMQGWVVGCCLSLEVWWSLLPIDFKRQNQATMESSGTTATSPLQSFSFLSGPILHSWN